MKYEEALEMARKGKIIKRPASPFLWKRIWPGLAAHDPGWGTLADYMDQADLNTDDWEEDTNPYDNTPPIACGRKVE